MSAASTMIDCRGEIVAGDTIRFVEAIFERFGYGGMEVAGKRAVTALVTKANTSARGTRTLTLRVSESSGHEALTIGDTVRRQSAKLDQGKVTRDVWADEGSRAELAAAARGDAAGAMRAKEEQRARARENLKLDAPGEYQDDDPAEFQRQRDELLAQAAEYTQNARREEYWELQDQIKRLDKESVAAGQKAIRAESMEQDGGSAA